MAVRKPKKKLAIEGAVVTLGDLVRDKVTGFEGVVLGKTDGAYGCRRFSIQPRGLKDQKLADTAHFDEPQLEVLEKAVIEVHQAPSPSRKAEKPEPAAARSSRKHGPRPDIQRRPDIGRQ